MGEKLLINSAIYALIVFLSFILSKKFKLEDIPDQSRKIHISPVSYAGGMSISLYFLFLINFNVFDIHLENILLYSFLIFVTGIIDDKINIKPSTKLLLIILPILILIYLGIFIDNLGQYEKIGILNLGKFKYIFCILCVLLVINAVNYIDGIDGLALSQTIISLIYLLFLTNNKDIIFYIYCLLIPFSINLLFNFNFFGKIKFFLGNSGSLVIGFVLSFLVIFLSKFEGIHPSYLIWSLFFYVYEFLSVNIVRILNKKSLFEAGKDHIHHALFYLFKESHYKTTFSLSIFSVIVIYLSYLINSLSNLLSLSLFIIMFFVYFLIRIKIFKKYKLTIK